MISKRLAFPTGRLAWHSSRVRLVHLRGGDYDPAPASKPIPGSLSDEPRPANPPLDHDVLAILRLGDLAADALPASGAERPEPRRRGDRLDLHRLRVRRDPGTIHP